MTNGATQTTMRNNAAVLAFNLTLPVSTKGDEERHNTRICVCCAVPHLILILILILILVLVLVLTLTLPSPQPQPMTNDDKRHNARHDNVTTMA